MANPFARGRAVAAPPAPAPRDIGKAGKPRKAAAPNLRAAFDPKRALLGITALPAGDRLVLPWPPKELNPNHRHAHPAAKSRFVKAYRQACWSETLAAFGVAAGGHMFPAEGPIAVQLDFFPPDGRLRDDDNCEAMFKAGRDGVAEALRLDDRRFRVTRAPIRIEYRGCVVMTFLKGDA
jgi:crossover junction endodeoxyribonuclease RusA